MERLIVYRFPIRLGVWTELRLPADLTKDEAKRLQVFVLTLAQDEETDED